MRIKEEPKRFDDATPGGQKNRPQTRPSRPIITFGKALDGAARKKKERKKEKKAEKKRGKKKSRR